MTFFYKRRMNWLDTEPLQENALAFDLLLMFQMEIGNNQTELALNRDTAWYLCSALNDYKLLLLGPCTVFNKSVSNEKYESVVQEYVPVNLYVSDYPVYKEYLDFFLSVTDEIEISPLFIGLLITSITVEYNC